MKRSLLLLVFAVGLVGCSSGGDAGARAGSTSAPDGATLSAALSSVAAAPTVPGAEGVTSVPGSALAQVPAASAVPTVPETGVPGLASDDPFCAAWSRFGGSWQVLAVASTFLADPAAVARWEVAASPVIAAAYAELIDLFPAELAAEASVVADGYFGVLARRSADALAALRQTGASPATIDEIGRAWVAALAARDPGSPEISLDLSAGDQAVVDEAAAVFSSRRVAFSADPSMVVAVDTPLTDRYLVAACPDRGTLTGLEVGGG